MNIGETTKLTKATSKSDSLRTTVPKGIVRQFGLHESDEIVWSIKAEHSELIICVNIKKE